MDKFKEVSLVCPSALPVAYKLPCARLAFFLFSFHPLNTYTTPNWISRNDIASLRIHSWHSDIRCLVRGTRKGAKSMVWNNTNSSHPRHTKIHRTTTMLCAPPCRESGDKENIGPSTERKSRWNDPSESDQMRDGYTMDPRRSSSLTITLSLFSHTTHLYTSASALPPFNQLNHCQLANLLHFSS